MVNVVNGIRQRGHAWAVNWQLPGLSSAELRLAHVCRQSGSRQRESGRRVGRNRGTAHCISLAWGCSVPAPAAAAAVCKYLNYFIA